MEGHGSLCGDWTCWSLSERSSLTLDTGFQVFSNYWWTRNTIIHFFPFVGHKGKEISIKKYGIL